jgi:hypothetical protein
MSNVNLDHVGCPEQDLSPKHVPLFSIASATSLINARQFGCVLLRFRFPNGEDFHIALCELGQPRIQHLLALLSKLYGVPVLLPPSDKFASAMMRDARREEKAQEPYKEIYAYA